MKHVYISFVHACAIVRSTCPFINWPIYTKLRMSVTEFGPIHTQNGGAFLHRSMYWKSDEYYTACVFVCVCSLRYTGRNAHMPYRHLWPTQLCGIFRTLSHNRHDFRGNTKCVSWISLQLLSETFLILGRTERDIIKNVYRSSTLSPFVTLFSRLTHSGRWSYFGKRCDSPNHI